MPAADQTLALLMEVENFPPGWDTECAVLEAKDMLRQGVDARTVTAIYGQDVTEKALQPQ